MTETQQAAIDTAHNGSGKGDAGVYIEHALSADAARESQILEEPRADGRTAEGTPCTPSFDLYDLKKDKQDNLGSTVREILWRQKNYAIYRTDKGVYVHFSDCPNEETDQRSRVSRTFIAFLRRAATTLARSTRATQKVPILRPSKLASESFEAPAIPPSSTGSIPVIIR